MCPPACATPRCMRWRRNKARVCSTSARRWSRATCSNGRRCSTGSLPQANMPNEVELKLRIRAADVPRLRHHLAVRQALVGKPVTRRLTSIYYDTPTLALLDTDLSLRVRRMSGGWFQAVKGAGHSLAGLHQRME